MNTPNQNINLNSPTVSVNWLNENLNAPNLIILDASIKKVTDNSDTNSKIQIPNTRFFDIKNTFSNTSAPFPNTVPSELQFTSEAQRLGINKNSIIVIYDNKGIYSSARAWWLFKAFGHNNVAVLDGGLLQWINAGFNTESIQNTPSKPGDFNAKYNKEYFKFFSGVKQISTLNTELILDARSQQRFDCLVPEPREGLRSGTIPNSKNLPFTSVQIDGIMKSKNELKTIFSNLNKEQKHMIFSCGSGITACVLALAAEIAELKNFSVYDGSWTEWGTLVN